MTTIGVRRGEIGVRRGEEDLAVTDAKNGIGGTIERERRVRGLSIKELAESASVSTGLLSQLERGIGNPSLATLMGLSKALGIHIGDFFQSSSEPDLVIHPHTRPRLTLAGGALTYQMLVPDLKGSLLMLYIELPRQFTNENQPFVHAGEEVIFVLNGHLEAHIGSRELELNTGDSIRYSSTIPHWYRTTNQKVTAISAMTPPSF